MNAILAAIARDPNVASEFKNAIKAPRWFRPLHGRYGRAFLSQADAEAYDRGYLAWPDHPNLATPSGPEWTGHNDRDREQMDRDEAREEAARDARDE